MRSLQFVPRAKHERTKTACWKTRPGRTSQTQPTTQLPGRTKIFHRIPVQKWNIQRLGETWIGRELQDLLAAETVCECQPGGVFPPTENAPLAFRVFTKQIHGSMWPELSAWEVLSSYALGMKIIQPTTNWFICLLMYSFNRNLAHPTRLSSLLGEFSSPACWFPTSLLGGLRSRGMAATPP